MTSYVYGIVYKDYKSASGSIKEDDSLYSNRDIAKRVWDKLMKAFDDAFGKDNHPYRYLYKIVEFEVRDE